MQDAVQAHIIAKNPTEGATIPKQSGSVKRVLNDRELDTFLDIIEGDEIWHDFFYTDLTTGLRRGEICGLMWQDYDEKNGTLKVSRTLHSKKLGVFSLGDTKTGMGMRTIVLPQSTAEPFAAAQGKFRQPVEFFLIPSNRSCPCRPTRPTVV